MAEETHLAPARYQIRPATKDDVSNMTDVFFKSFNAPFWGYLFPDTGAMRTWWHEAWLMGLNNPTDRTFVVEDTEKDDRVVAFSRWMVPQPDGNLERIWPSLDKGPTDMEVAEMFFGGMEESRHKAMGSQPHWMLELLGVDERYQKSGIGASLIKWGTVQADKSGLPTYLDASEIGQPYYTARHNFSFAQDINIPDRPAYGSVTYKSLVRPPNGKA